MSIDLSKLPPAPWFVTYSESTDDYGNGPASLSIGPHEDDVADSFMFSENFGADDPRYDLDAVFDFVVLARNAEDVMMRLGFQPRKTSLGWEAVGPNECTISEELRIDHQHPFEALVAAGEWLKARDHKQ